MAISRIPSNHLNQRPVSKQAPPNQKPVNNVGPQVRTMPAPALSQTKPADSVKISPDALAQVVKPPVTAPSTPVGPPALDKNCVCNSSPTLQQDRHALQADQRDVRQNFEDKDDDDGGKDKDGNIEEVEGHNNDVNADKLKLPQNLPVSARTHDTPQNQRGGQKDDRHVIRHDLQDVQKAQPVLHQDLPSDPRVEKILRDLRSLVADLEKA